MDIIAGGYSVSNLSTKNVILGKNGCGKSYLLKQIDQATRGAAGFGEIRYISPERGGLLEFDPNVENQVTNSPNWLTDVRRNNQANQFRQQSAGLFRRLELLVLREIEREAQAPGYVPRSFDQTIDRLNGLLERVKLERDNVKPFRIVVRDTGAVAAPTDISSGETELISLGIEIASFVREATPGVTNLLLMDEPDVHLHPDLQDRLARYMLETLAGSPVTFILATHSTALLAALAEHAETCVAFKRRGDVALEFKPISEVDRAILPIFGAHPLSNVFNQAPVLLIEGEDDERIWQQAVRSSQGRVRVFPCVAESVDHLAEFEAEVNNVIDAVYDDARAYSLRDRDLHPEFIADVGHVVRMRLSCRAAENLMLSDGALALAQTNWPDLQQAIVNWAQVNVGHPYHAHVMEFIDGGFDRNGHDLKQIRNILVGLMTNKPWEVLVGQAIAALARDGGDPADGSLRHFLGPKVSEQILHLPPAEQVPNSA